jgi:hypothetical protein
MILHVGKYECRAKIKAIARKLFLLRSTRLLE